MEKKGKGKSLDETKTLRESLARLEKELETRRMESLFLGALFDGISEEIMVVDQDFLIRDANRAFLKGAGLPKAEVTGRKCYDVREKAGSACMRSTGSCPLELARKTGKRIESTHQHTTPGGTIRESFLIMYPLKCKSKGTEFFIEIARDVTEYRNLIIKLQNSEKRLRAILDTATNAILSINEDQKIILFNSAAQQMFGYTASEILGKSLNVLVPSQYGDHARFVKRFLERREVDGMGKTLHLTALRKGGGEFPIEINLSCMEMEGKLTFTGIIRDVSEERQMERKLLQSERLAAVGQAVAHVAHEIKNPLMIIGGFAGQIRRNLQDERDAVKVDMILDEVKRLERLVAGLGDFTKTYRLVKRPAELSAIIKDVIRIMAGVYPPESFSFSEEYDGNLGEIDCDPDKLKQVFINIFSNGCEAMADGGRITISMARVPTGVEIRISDHGVGIPEDQLRHVFEPFYTTREKGLGLGLAISYKIIEAHGGEISAESEPGKGTTFIIRLPDA
ncbi:MAG: PAS domain S-box protein [Deltaproteobacteria bacterium]|nr:PAS domain S-box protein [Deltaproteobacteria bacterium]